MALILELEPEVERQLEIEAARLGVSKETRVAQLLTFRFENSNISALHRQGEQEKHRAQDIAARLEAWKEFGERAQEYSKNAPRWNDEDISRESIYGERGL